MDEATANVDPQTDLMIQKIVKETFVNCTVLIIAHRLETVMDSDKILVLDDGRLIEFDKTNDLLMNQNGVFYRMIKEARG